MALYRIYPLNPDNSVAKGLKAKCETDQDACELAQRVVLSGQQAEVWCGERLVARVSGATAKDISRHYASWLAQM